MSHQTDLTITAQFLDKLITVLDLKNDAALARTMKVAPPVISKLRSGRLTFGPLYIIKAHKLTGMTVRQVEAELGIADEFPQA